MAKLLSEVLGSRKYAEIKTRSSRISPSMKFANLLVYGCILDVITSISSVAKVKANCEGVEYKQQHSYSLPNDVKIYNSLNKNLIILTVLLYCYKTTAKH